MALFACSLNSGSNGNVYYIGTDREAVLVDAGLSCRETERRMKRAGLSMETVRALFISHEHSDHIRGVEVLARKYRLPVYITPSTLSSGGLSVDPAQVRPFAACKPVAVGELEVTPFPKQHDATEPHSFIVSGRGVTVGVFTDIGASCAHVIDNFSRCHAAFLEANYDDHMLESGDYPYYLKRRIRSDHGHLSNAQALELFLSRGRHFSHLFLAHLSRDNNDPALVEELFTRHSGSTQIVVASRYNETAVYRVAPGDAGSPVFQAPVAEQMRLF